MKIIYFLFNPSEYEALAIEQIDIMNVTEGQVIKIEKQQQEKLEIFLDYKLEELFDENYSFILNFLCDRTTNFTQGDIYEKN